MDEPLANRVRSGRKQPQRARHGSLCQPPTFQAFGQQMAAELAVARFSDYPFMGNIRTAIMESATA
ncbi:hypothetical protein GCM10011385_11490 [Nitratireductor aestuarii]|uniref:Uncharacterized protein n=1 Tax=Nitratireductor aestuarii TaxID=1735103 RepID=A0A916W1V4_9HYPH|nr:hypothetical protein GCM10011385_11490 [Nitratireductor aestuarii]